MEWQHKLRNEFQSLKSPDQNQKRAFKEIPDEITNKMELYLKEREQGLEPYQSQINSYVENIKSLKTSSKELYDQIQELERLTYRKNYGLTTFTPAKMQLNNKEYFYRQRYINNYLNKESEQYLGDLQNLDPERFGDDYYKIGTSLTQKGQQERITKQKTLDEKKRDSLTSQERPNIPQRDRDQIPTHDKYRAFEDY